MNYLEFKIAVCTSIHFLAYLPVKKYAS